MTNRKINRINGKDGPNFLLINLHSFNNAGDASLAYVAISQLKSFFPGCHITLAMNDIRSYHGRESVVGSLSSFVKWIGEDGSSKWRVIKLFTLPIKVMFTVLIFRLFNRIIFVNLPEDEKALLSTYFNADAIVSAPGNFLYSSGIIGYQYLLSIFSLIIAILIKKPLYLLPQSIGPLKHKWEQSLLRWTLSKARLIMLRESISSELVQALGIANEHYIHIPDLAFDYTVSASEEARHILVNHGIDVDLDRPLLGITTIDLPKSKYTLAHQILYENAVGYALEQFLDKHEGKAVFFSQVCGSNYVADDRRSIYRIAANLLEWKEQIILIDDFANPEVLKGAYGFMDLFLGTRMHSNIFAMTEGVPTLALAYFPKTVGIMQNMGLGQWVIDVNQINNVTLSYKLEALWRERDSIKSLIRDKIPNLASQASKAVRYMADDFDRFNSSVT